MVRVESISEKEFLLAKVEQALDSMRPFLRTDGGDVQLIDIDEKHIVQIRLLGNCRSCSMSSMTMKAGIEDAIRHAAPQIAGVVAVDF